MRAACALAAAATQAGAVDARARDALAGSLLRVDGSRRDDVRRAARCYATLRGGGTDAEAAFAWLVASEAPARRAAALLRGPRTAATRWQRRERADRFAVLLFAVDAAGAASVVDALADPESLVASLSALDDGAACSPWTRSGREAGVRVLNEATRTERTPASTGMPARHARRCLTFTAASRR